jgi:integrase
MGTSGSVRQDRHGWYFVVNVPALDGKRKQVRRRGFETKKGAQAALTAMLGDLQRGTFVHPVRLTLGEYLGTWLTTLPAMGRRASTVESYRRVLERHVIPRLGLGELQKVSPLDLDALYAAMLAAPEGGRPLSHRTVRFTHSVIGKALADAERKGLVARNVARLASPPSTSSSRAPEMRVWSPADLRALLALTADHRFGALFRVAAMTGLRRAELCGLSWLDVDLDMARLTVRRSLTAVRSQLVEGEPKTTRGRRAVDLDAVTVAVLRAHRTAQREQRMLLGSAYRDLGYVFAAPDGAPSKPDTVGQAFERIVARSGLPRIRFHDLRHTHASHLLAAGVNVKIVSERLGHASASFTLDVYGHVMPGQQASAAAAAAALVDDAGPV